MAPKGISVTDIALPPIVLCVLINCYREAKKVFTERLMIIMILRKITYSVKFSINLDIHDVIVNL